MDLFFSAFMTFGSYLLISYFIYNILGRNRKIPIAVLCLLLFSSLLRLVNVYRQNYEFNVVAIVFMVYVLPVLVAFYVFLMITGGISFLKFKRTRKLKSISSDIQTKYFLVTIYFTLLTGSLLFGLGAYFFIEDYLKWVILAFSLLIFILSIYLLVKIKKIKSERVILIIGKDTKTFYQYIIPNRKYKVLVTDFYTNENYIVDPIGEVKLTLKDKMIDKHYLYWIATNDKVNMKDEKNVKPYTPVYHEIIDQFEKYHYRQMNLSIEQGKVVITHEKLIK